MAVHLSKGGEQGSEGRCAQGIDLSRIDSYLDEIAKEQQEQKPDGFTIRDYIEQKGVHENTARRHLQALVKAGKLEVHRWVENQRTYNIYQFTETDNAEHEL